MYKDDLSRFVSNVVVVQLIPILITRLHY